MFEVIIILAIALSLSVAIHHAGLPKDPPPRDSDRPWFLMLVVNFPLMLLISGTVVACMEHNFWPAVGWTVAWAYCLILFAVIPYRSKDVSMRRHLMGAFFWPFYVSIGVRVDPEELKEHNELMEEIKKLVPPKKVPFDKR